MGGHFSYGAIGGLSGRAMILASLASGALGAGLGTIFHKSVRFLKRFLWPVKPSKAPWKCQVLVKTSIGLVVGILSYYFPQTLFWGEGSLQCMIDGQRTAFSATHHGLSTALTSQALVNPGMPFPGSLAALKVGAAKLFAITLACAGKFPGGIIFPLFFAAPPFAHAFSSYLSSSILPVMVICTMASTQASVTRTPLATALILSLSASVSSELSILLPACLLASYFGVFVSQLLSRKSYFEYQRP